MWLSEAANEKHMQIIPKQKAVVFLYSQTYAQIWCMWVIPPISSILCKQRYVGMEETLNFLVWMPSSSKY